MHMCVCTHTHTGMPISLPIKWPFSARHQHFQSSNEVLLLAVSTEGAALGGHLGVLCPLTDLDSPRSSPINYETGVF